MAGTALLTGGAGFIGCHLAPLLLDRGYRVAVMDSLHPQVHTGSGIPVALANGVQFIAGDVTSPTNWHSVLRLVRPTVIFHLAAETGTGQSLTESSRHTMVNVVGTSRMLDALHSSGIVPEHFVLTSSRAVYGDGAWTTGDGRIVYPGARTRPRLEACQWDPVDEDGGSLRPLPAVAGVTEPRPISVYAATKLAQEHVLSAWATAFGSKLSVLRLQNVYGPGQSVANSYTGVLTYFASQSLNGHQLDVYEDGEIIRDFVHVSDVANALAACVDRPPEAQRLLDIGSGHSRTILEVARMIAAANGGPAPKISGRFRDGDVRAAWCSNDAAREALGWQPAMTLTDGIRSLLDWVNAESNGS